MPKPLKKYSTSTKSTTEIKVKWKKVENVSGYKVYVWNSKKSKYVLYKTTNKTSVTIKRPCSGDTDVSFYVRTYKKVGKKTYYSKDYYSDYEYLKPTAPSVSIKKSDFGEFYINFKNYAYYQVQVFANKSFKNTSNNYVSTWKGWTNSVRCTSPSGQKRYVRARRYYYDKKGNLKVGPWSKVKTVTPY